MSIQQQQRKQRCFFFYPLRAWTLVAFLCLIHRQAKICFYISKENAIVGCFLSEHRTSARKHTRHSRTTNKNPFFMTHSSIPHVSHNIFVWHAFFSSFTSHFLSVLFYHSILRLFDKRALVNYLPLGTHSHSHSHTHTLSIFRTLTKTMTANAVFINGLSFAS